MRLRTVNRLCLLAVSSTVVTSLLAGCHPHPAKPAGAMPRSGGMPMTSTQPPIDMSTTMPATMTPPLPATMEAATSPATLPVVPPVTAPITPAVPPVTQPVAPPATMATTTTTTMPTTMAATMPVPPSTQAATMPAVPPIANAPRPTDKAIITTDAILAERLAGVAELEFATKVTNQNAWPWIWRHQIALLAACGELDPGKARFPRLEALAWAQLHDEAHEIDALNRAIFCDQNDSFSWIRDIDLRLKSMQTADEKLTFIDSLVNHHTAFTPPPDVQAHALFCKVKTLQDRGQDDAATKVLAQALVLCPASMECLNLRYSMLSPNASRFERCGQLLDLLRANPLQSRYSAQLADLVADSGLVQESLPWFQLAVSTLHYEGQIGSHSMLNLAAEYYLADEKPDALRINEALLKLDPANTQARLLQLVITRSMGDKDAYTKAMQEAGNTLNNRVVDAINAAMPAAPKAATRPISDPTQVVVPDLGPAVAQLAQGGSPAVKQQFAEAVADMAMLQGYFAQQPEVTAKLVDALEQVVPKDSPELARLRGWNMLLTGKSDDADKTFALAATQDPLAELGMIQVMLAGSNAGKKQQAESMGRRLIVDHASGLLGAILWEKLHNDRVKLIPSTQATAMQTALEAYPKELFSTVDSPRLIYGLHIAPTPIPSYVGEPVLGTVEISNLSNEDITIGPEGLIKPELLFKVTPEVGATPPSFDELDSIAGPTVLGAKQQISQLVRLDQTQLLAAMGPMSGVAFEISTRLTSNQAINRVGGYEVSMLQKFYRQASPPSPANILMAMNNAATGRPDQKITALSLIEMFVGELRSVKTPADDTTKQIANMLEVIHHARIDPLPAVSAWAMKCEAELDNDHRESIIRDLVESEDWRHRQIGLLMLGSVAPAVRDEILTKLTVDPQGSVRADASATQGIATLMPTTMPTQAAP